MYMEYLLFFINIYIFFVNEKNETAFFFDEQ